MNSPALAVSSRPKTAGILLTVAVAQFVLVLDVSIVNLALPAIRDDLGLSRSGFQKASRKRA